MLLVYTAGANGVRFGRLDPKSRVSAAAHDAETVFPGSRAHLRASATVAWHREPFTGGTYTAFAPGEVVPVLGLAAAPVRPGAPRR